MNLRDPDFKASYNAYIESTLFSSNPKKLDEENVSFLIKILYIY